MTTAVISVQEPIRLETTKEINGLWSGFAEIQKDDYVTVEGYVEFDNELYIIRTIEDSIYEGSLTQKLYLDHIMSELNSYMIAPFDATTTGTATLESILAGTGWSVRSVNVSGSKKVYSEKRISVLAALNLAADEWGGELYFYSPTRSVDFLTQIGNSTLKHQVRYDKNAKYITRRIDSTKLVTRLFGYGADDITIGSVNSTGQEYLDSAAISSYDKRKEYTIYTNISTKADLKTYMQAYLDVYDSEFYYYTAGMADLSVISAYADEKIRLGDTLMVYNADMGINVDVRVKKLILDYCNPLNMYIELDNKADSLAKDLEKMLYRLEAVSPYINDYRALDLRNVVVPKDISTGLPICFCIYVGGILQAGYYQGPIVHVHTACTAVEVFAYCKYKPTVSDVQVCINKTGTPIGYVVIPANGGAVGELGAPGRTYISTALGVDDLLNIDILATDGVAQGLTVELRCR